MYRRFLTNIVFISMVLCLASAALGQDPLGSNPPVFQTIGMLDTETHFLDEEQCRVCHDEGVPDRHHLLYDELIPDITKVPYPDTNGDGNPDTNYSCLSCHGPNFVLERDCFVCHTGDSPHHVGQDAFDRHCTACHGHVDDYDDDHYIPEYAASLVTPWQGLSGDGYENAPYPTPDVASDGSGLISSADLVITEAGPPYFSVNVLNNGTGLLPTTEIRNQPAALKFKPSGENNDVFIGSTHHGGEEYTVEISEGALAASWDGDAQKLSFSVPAAGVTALELVNTIQAETAADDDVEATLGYDGNGSVDPPLDPTHFEPIGADPPNNRGFGAGSCSYCHDHDGALDANGDVAPVLIVNNHDTHHHNGLLFFVSDGQGGSWRKCNICHNYTDRAAPDPATYSDQSGPAFDLHIRICEECHGPESLHNIQADSNGDGIVIGGEDPGYGHVGADGGPDASDCWGCHGFAFSGDSTAPFSGPVIPTLYNTDTATATAGAATTVLLNGAAFTNEANGNSYESDVRLTDSDGSSVTLEPDVILDGGSLAVTIPETTLPGNYRIQATKDGKDSNSSVISITPDVTISRVMVNRGVTTIYGSGFGGYAEGSGTEVVGTYVMLVGRRPKTMTMKGKVISWSDGRIAVSFRRNPRTVSVQSVFGLDRYTIVPD